MQTLNPFTKQHDLKYKERSSASNKKSIEQINLLPLSKRKEINLMTEREILKGFDKEEEHMRLNSYLRSRNSPQKRIQNTTGQLRTLYLEQQFSSYRQKAHKDKQVEKQLNYIQRLKAITRQNDLLKKEMQIEDNKKQLKRHPNERPVDYQSSQGISSIRLQNPNRPYEDQQELVKKYNNGIKVKQYNQELIRSNQKSRNYEQENQQEEQPYSLKYNDKVLQNNSQKDRKEPGKIVKVYSDVKKYQERPRSYQLAQKSHDYLPLETEQKRNIDKNELNRIQQQQVKNQYSQRKDYEGQHSYQRYQNYHPSQIQQENRQIRRKIPFSSTKKYQTQRKYQTSSKYNLNKNQINQQGTIKRKVNHTINNEMSSGKFSKSPIKLLDNISKISQANYYEGNQIQIQISPAKNKNSFNQLSASKKVSQQKNKSIKSRQSSLSRFSSASNLKNSKHRLSSKEIQGSSNTIQSSSMRQGPQQFLNKLKKQINKRQQQIKKIVSIRASNYQDGFQKKKDSNSFFAILYEGDVKYRNQVIQKFRNQTKHLQLPRYQSNSKVIINVSDD